VPLSRAKRLRTPAVEHGSHWIKKGDGHAENPRVDPKAPLARCDDCPLRDRPFVHGYGPPMTDRVLVGQAPAAEEVVQGKPFVGPSGQRLDKALTAAAVDRRALYVTNTVLCLLHDGDNGPHEKALEACRDRLIAEIRERMPRKRLDGNTEVRVTYHPAAALRRRRTWGKGSVDPPGVRPRSVSAATRGRSAAIGVEEMTVAKVWPSDAKHSLPSACR
jgi:hypothetical protein